MLLNGNITDFHRICPTLDTQLSAIITVLKAKSRIDHWMHLPHHLPVAVMLLL